MRVLILATPFDERARLDGSRRAIADLVPALAARGVLPTVLVASGAPPTGARALTVSGGRNTRALEVAMTAAITDVDLVHAWFTPRFSTGAFLRALRAPVLQTVASVPASYVGASLAIGGDFVVTTSDATAVAVAMAGIDASKMARVPSPFAQEPFTRESVARAERAPRDLLLYVGDYEADDGIDRTLSAFAKLAPPRSVIPHLAIAARTKSDKSREVEAKLRKRIAETTALRGRVTILGELPSLLPWIAAARGVLLPASTTYAKLDHPRALLEAIALGVRIVVGTAPSLSELVDDPRVGEIARDTSELREAMERCFELPPAPTSSILRLLQPRRPEIIGARYVELYERLLAARGGTRTRPR